VNDRLAQLYEMIEKERAGVCMSVYRMRRSESRGDDGGEGQSLKIRTEFEEDADYEGEASESKEERMCAREDIPAVNLPPLSSFFLFLFIFQCELKKLTSHSSALKNGGCAA